MIIVEREGTNMKKRLDFVTNSSSSSYICEICGHIDSGYDATLDYLGFCQCSNGHVLCKTHLLEENRDAYIQYLIKEFGQDLSSSDIVKLCKKETLDEIDDFLYSKVQQYRDGWDIPTILCPVCQMKAMTMHDINRYKNMLLSKTDTEIERMMIESFATYDDLMKYLYPIKGVNNDEDKD